MKNRIASYLSLLILLSFFACKKESTTPIDDYVEGDFFWTASTFTERGGKNIDLYFNNPSYVIDYYKKPLDPDFFEVYFSNDPENLPLFKKITDINTEKLAFNNLANDEAYYFQVVTGKKGFESITSAKVMTTLGPTPEMEAVFPQVTSGVERLTYSFDKSYFTFNSDRGSNDNIYIQKTGTPFSFEVLDDTNYSIGWSPVKNELVYIKDTLVGNFVYPRQLIRYDVATKLAETIITIDYNEYNIHQPRFTADGEKLLFLSNEGNEEKSSYDFWTYDLTTQEKNKHTDFQALGFEILEVAPKFIANNQLFLSGSYQGVSKAVDVFTYNYATNTLTPVIESEWSVNCPTGSPSGNKVAFFSYRSGTEQLWVYDLNSQKYKQITDRNSHSVDGRYSRIVWEDEQTIITSAYSGNRMQAVRMELE